MTTPAGRAAAPGTPMRVPPVQLIAVVAAGGAAGALARHAVEKLVPWPATGWPWGIFLVNMLGCLMIGIATGLLADARSRRARVPSWWRPLVVTGFLGGFTTFSTYIVEIVVLMDSSTDSATLTAMAYMVGSVALGGLAVWLGLRVSTRVPWRLWSTDVDIG